MTEQKYQEAPEVEEEQVDASASTGEVLSDQQQVPPLRAIPHQPTERAANGAVLEPPSATTGTFLDILEDGEFSLDAYHELKELAAQIRLLGQNGAKAKGKAVITINMEYEGEALRVGADIKVTKPELPRRKSIVWQDDADNFTRFPPRQTQLFGSARQPRVV